MMIRMLCLLAVLLVGSGGHAGAEFPSLIESIRVDGPLNFCREPVPLSRQAVRERFEKELLLILWDRPQVILWIKRANRYLPIIGSMLASEEMPEDLKYVAIVESALRPHVGSVKGAIGFWQFMKGTGRKYGLRIDEAVDERRSIFASTQAAIRYFQELHGLFGSWTLAAAAFNMGERGLEAEMMAQNTNDYYELYLPLETQRYILRIVAAKLILSQPQRYGFDLKPSDLYPPLSVERVQIKCPYETPVALLAEASGTSFKHIKDLNPELRGHYLSSGTHMLLLPAGAPADLHRRFKKLANAWKTEQRQHIYVVRQGENLSAIAERFKVPLAALLIWNRIDPRRPIHPGDRLFIYPRQDLPAAE